LVVAELSVLKLLEPTRLFILAFDLNLLCSFSGTTAEPAREESLLGFAAGSLLLQIKGVVEYFLKVHLVPLSLLALKLFKLSLLGLIGHGVEHVKDGIGSTHEVRVVRVDVSVFDRNEIPDHLVARS
jgi:hypothetical protein